MPLWLAIVIAVIVLLAVGGALARRRQLARTQGRFEVRLAEVNRDLAAAHAQDRGWAPDTLDAAARTAWAAERPDAEAESLTLIQIVDNPGTDEDKAVFELRSGDRVHRLTLGRRDGEWVGERLE